MNTYYTWRQSRLRFKMRALWFIRHWEKILVKYSHARQIIPLKIGLFHFEAELFLHIQEW